MTRQPNPRGSARGVPWGAGLLALAMGLCLGADCGFERRDKLLHEPCTRDVQCAAPLVCRSGACEPAVDGSDAGPDGGSRDASTP